MEGWSTKCSEFEVTDGEHEFGQVPSQCVERFLLVGEHDMAFGFG